MAMHLAGLFNVPSVIIWGINNPDVWGPYNNKNVQYVRNNSGITNKECITSIMPDKVIDACNNVISKMKITN